VYYLVNVVSVISPCWWKLNLYLCSC